MRIGIDFDGTFDQDPQMWGRFIDDAVKSGHCPMIVTGRRHTTEDYDYMRKAVNSACSSNPPIFFTELVAKAWWMNHREDILIDVWIDNEPEYITKNR